MHVNDIKRGLKSKAIKKMCLKTTFLEISERGNSTGCKHKTG